MIHERGHWKKDVTIYGTVSRGEAENIRKTIQDLFRQTCILLVKCDPATLVQHDNPRYQVCLRHREFIADYLSVLDCELVHDPQEHIFRITGGWRYDRAYEPYDNEAGHSFKK